MQRLWWRKQVHITTRWDHIRKMPTHTRQSQGASSMVIPIGVPNGGKAVRGVCVQLIPPKVTLVRKVMSPVQSMTGTCNVRLPIWRESCVMPGENTPHLAPNHHSRSRMELVTSGGQELRPVRLSPMKRTIDIGTEARLVGAWVTMPWTKHWAKFPNHPSRGI